ncbi:MAG TPA: Ig-like domain-containing protein, partial [Chthoniobacteraceae bacterium]
MFDRIRHLLSLLIGDFSWKPPGWLASSSRRSLRWVQSHQRLSGILALCLLVISAAGWGIRSWLRQLPKPATISVTAFPVAISQIEKEIHPSALVLEFSGAVAPIETERKKPLTSGVHLDPPLEGKWTWTSDRMLSFRPIKDWPAGQKFRVTLEPTLVPPRILLERHEIEFKTPMLTASFEELEFYTDLNDPTVKQVVAVFSFSHSIDPAELEKLLSLETVGGSAVFKSGQP